MCVKKIAKLSAIILSGSKVNSIHIKNQDTLVLYGLDTEVIKSAYYTHRYHCFHIDIRKTSEIN